MTAVAARRGRWAIALWLVFLLACGIVISRSPFSADLSAFLPRSPTPEQLLLTEQLRDGLASRLILAGIEGADAPTRAALSKQLAQRLRAERAFVTVNNGEPVYAERDRALLFNHRYLLSPAVTPARFSVDGLKGAVSESIDLLASPAGLLTRAMLPRDPTGEMVQLLEQMNSGSRPRLFEGAWASHDGTRALLLIRTRALGSDIDGQQLAMAAIRQAFAAAAATAGAAPAAASARLVMTGPGVFAVTSRATIQQQVHRLSIISVVIIAVLLGLVYRSFSALLLGFLPVLSGALAGIAAVSLGFGVVHGITVGFGTALIGEAVDYSIYLFVQSERSGADPQDWVSRFWPTIRLGVLTSICGFASLLLSGFPGLAQLGLYAITGLVIAALVTRFVLPHLLPENFRIHDVSALGIALGGLLRHASRLRYTAVLLLLAACAVVVVQRGSLWNNSLSGMLPLSSAEMALDSRLRADMGAPDVRYLVVAAGASREAVLQQAEQVSAILQTQVDNATLVAFESPSRFLPSSATQRARQASLPERAELEARLAQALRDLPLNAQRLTPFLADVAAAREQPLLQAADLEQSSLAMAVDALLMQRGTVWNALLPLTGPPGADIDAGRIRAALAGGPSPQAVLVDLKGESDRLYAGYLHEAIVLSLGGLAAIVTLLLITLRSPLRVLRIVAPLAAAVVTVTAALALLGQQLIILHLVGLLLVAAVGSNYALFFDRLDAGAAAAATTATAAPRFSPRTLASMLLANLTTVAGFGLLAFSDVAILKAMGVTVAPGVILALLYAAIFAKKSDA